MTHTALNPNQLAMVMDLNKCLGCQTCTVACKNLWTTGEGQQHMYWNHVETTPGRGYPRDWRAMGGGRSGDNLHPGQLPSCDDSYGHPSRFNHSQVILNEGWKSTFLKPSAPDGSMPTWGPNWDEDQGSGQFPNSYMFYLPRLCNHCEYPACRDACPRAAIEKRASDGIVVVNQDRCNGYRFCAEACPYKKIFFDHLRQVADKCIFCFPRVEQGIAPACARMCPGRLRFVGRRGDSASSIHKLVEVWKVALPLHPEYGTGPNVFYVPPLSPEAFDAQGRPTGQDRIPISELVALFGESVHPALATLRTEREKARQGQASELMDLLIARDWHSNFKLGELH